MPKLPLNAFDSLAGLNSKTLNALDEIGRQAERAQKLYDQLSASGVLRHIEEAQSRSASLLRATEAFANSPLMKAAQDFANSHMAKAAQAAVDSPLVREAERWSDIAEAS